MATVIYEITAIVREVLIADYEEYMTRTHIPDLMATGSFAAASFSRSVSGRYRIRYEATSRELLDIYLRDHASRLREDMIRTFPEGIELNREEWEVLAAF